MVWRVHHRATHRFASWTASILWPPTAILPRPAKVDRTFALIDELSEPLDEALCSQAVEAAIRTQRGKVANRFMETCLGKEHISCLWAQNQWIDLMLMYKCRREWVITSLHQSTQENVPTKSILSILGMSVGCQGIDSTSCQKYKRIHIFMFTGIFAFTHFYYLLIYMCTCRSMPI